MTKPIPDYKKRTSIAIEINKQWENCAIADVEYDAMMKALYSEVTVKQQDRVRLGRFIEKFKDQISLNDEREMLR